MSIPVFSVPGLIAWLETQDPETTYDYTVAETCVMTRYFGSAGIERKDTFFYGPITVEEGVWNRISQLKPWTYGAALARAKELATP